MADSERTEKVRQELMRLHELLALMRSKLGAGERAYEELFAGFAPDEIAELKHKDLQWKLAERLADLEPLRQAVSWMRFEARELEKAFAELDAIIAATPDAAADAMD